MFLKVLYGANVTLPKFSNNILRLQPSCELQSILYFSGSPHF